VAVLKGKDAVLGKAVLSAADMTNGCVKIYLQPLLDEEQNYSMGGYLLPKFPNPKFKVPQRMTSDTLESKFKTMGCLGQDNLEHIWVCNEKLCHEPDKIGETEFSAWDNFGNEASTIYLYVKSFLYVEFAPYNERKKMMEKANQQIEELSMSSVGQKEKGKGKSSSAPNKKAKVDE